MMQNVATSHTSTLLTLLTLLICIYCIYCPSIVRVLPVYYEGFVGACPRKEGRSSYLSLLRQKPTPGKATPHSKNAMHPPPQMRRPMRHHRFVQ